MKIIVGLALGSALTISTWLSGADPHAAVTGLPGSGEWPAVVAMVAANLPAPDLGAQPSRVRAFFDRLTGAQRAALVRQAPGVVGNLDGTPTLLRYAANSLASGLPDRQLLGYDSRGDGQLIEVFGDLDSARHVAVVVPGSGWRLDNLLAGGPAKAHPLRVGRELHARLTREVAGMAVPAGVAVVVWVGYDTPEAIDRQAARSERAMAGAPRLAHLLDSLPAQAHVTVLCHSYGAVVCGLADPERPAGDVVAMAAPGMDVGSAAQLRIAHRVWAARTPDDHIRFVPAVRLGGYGHRSDPVDSAFGAQVFRTGEARGHDGYYQPGSESLANVARIVLGRSSEVTLVHDPR